MATSRLKHRLHLNDIESICDLKATEALKKIITHFLEQVRLQCGNTQDLMAQFELNAEDSEFLFEVGNLPLLRRLEAKGHDLVKQLNEWVRASAFGVLKVEMLCLSRHPKDFLISEPHIDLTDTFQVVFSENGRNSAPTYVWNRELPDDWGKNPLRDNDPRLVKTLNYPIWTPLPPARLVRIPSGWPQFSRYDETGVCLRVGFKLLQEAHKS